MLIPFVTIILGLVLLVWSADRFVEGAASAARHWGMSPLLIGMVIVGFGTSAPEMLVSAMAALDGNPNLALGNAYGSNIVNVGLILGVTALIKPILVHSSVVRKELPILLAITALSGYILWDRDVTRLDATILLVVFFAYMTWSIVTSRRNPADAFGEEIKEEVAAHAMPLDRALLWLVIGLAALLVSSRMLVWGAVEVATALGVSDLIIGLTIVAVGTSLPEFASSLMAARKGEHDIAIGNVVGSNLFNALAVVGIAGAITPMSDTPAELFYRDWSTMLTITIALFVFAYGFKGQGRINRVEGGSLLLGYVAYTGYLVWQTLD